MSEIDKIKSLFGQYPQAKELYQDAKGICWLVKKTAELQSKGREVKTFKKADFFKKETIKDNKE